MKEFNIKIKKFRGLYPNIKTLNKLSIDLYRSLRLHLYPDEYEVEIIK